MLSAAPRCLALRVAKCGGCLPASICSAAMRKPVDAGGHEVAPKPVDAGGHKVAPRRSARLRPSDATAAVAAAVQKAAVPPPKRRKTRQEPAGLSGKGEGPAGLSRKWEERWLAKGFKCVVGVDEAGRGPLAGPVVAACVCIPIDVHLDGVNDSKQLRGKQREQLFEQLTTHPRIQWAAATVDVVTIDKINILQASMRAMELAVEGLGAVGEDAAILVDGNRLPQMFDPARSEAVVKGDTKAFAIAAASIIAKVTRDRLMLALHESFPLYGFDSHKGYGVPAHMAAIKQLGPCPAHRRTFAPMKTEWFPQHK